jgi:hypothetical protein
MGLMYLQVTLSPVPRNLMRVILPAVHSGTRCSMSLVAHLWSLPSASCITSTVSAPSFPISTGLLGLSTDCLCGEAQRAVTAIPRSGPALGLDATLPPPESLAVHLPPHSSPGPDTGTCTQATPGPIWFPSHPRYRISSLSCFSLFTLFPNFGTLLPTLPPTLRSHHHHQQ